LPTPDEAAPRDAATDLAEQERLIEHQLRYFYDEVLQLRKERFEVVYTATWLVVRPLLWLEERLVGGVRGLFRRGSPAARSPAVPARLASGTPPAPGRLLIDVTGTLARDMGTGIERVARDLSTALVAADPGRVRLVRCDRGRLMACPTAFEKAARDKERELTVEPGDRLLLLTDAWNHPELYDGVCDALRRGGGGLIVCLHDVIPERHPAACHERTVALFRPWLREALENADGVLTISGATRDDLLRLISDRGLRHRPGLPLAAFHNATRFAPCAGEAAPQRAKRLFRDRSPVFLCVGTFEPRKGQQVALDAFERLWARGKDWRLVFVGRRGWLDHALAARVRAHAEQGRRLFWFEDADDAELAYLYTRMSALIFPSFTEGFGLPMIEAARCGRPVICSDIPVFREIGRDGALYFKVNDPDALAARLLDWEAGRAEAHPERILQIGWADAAARILDVVMNDHWDVRLPAAETSP
jgi:glycosyltransferase involved in cell wall biosynthesis